jgi:prepilin-type processing-associated H-X9-DG protein
LGSRRSRADICDTSPYQNIYAPWALEQLAGWRMFYGGWDGSDTPNDRVYSVTTADFLTFDNRTLVIDHGAFQHVNNVNVQKLADGSLHMVCTGGPYDQLSWPTYFSSPDGVTWNGSPEPYQAQLSDIVDIQGYPNYQYGGFNGGNVLFWDGSWILYFFDNNATDTHVFRATGVSPQAVQFRGPVLATGRDPNAVVKFTDGHTWYLMGLNTPGLAYSLSKDGITFGSEQTLFSSLSSFDTFIDSVSFVTHGTQLLGVLYGANASPPQGPPSAPNQIYARWLQKKIVITDSSGARYFAQGSYGPNRQWFQAPASGFLEGTMVVYAEDGVTPLGSSLVNLSAGKVYGLVLQ